MTSLWMILLGVAVVALVVGPMSRPGGLTRALARAKVTGDLEAVVAHVERLTPSAQADAWHQVMARLWERYDRELAARLMVEAAPRCDAKIVQYWIRQALEIEPEIAQEVFTPMFLATHFRADDAAQCGKASCCGSKCG